MKFGALLISLLTITLAAHANYAVDQAERDVIVKWRTLRFALDAESHLQSFAAQIEHVSPALPVDPREGRGLERITVVRLSSRDDVSALVESLRNDPAVEYVEPRPIRHTHEFRREDRQHGNTLDGAPNDPFFNIQWGLQQIEIESAWNVTRGSADVAIAVVDVGVWFGHPDLSAQRWENEAERFGLTDVDDDNNGYVDDVFGYDFVDLDGDPTPDPFEQDETHGTHVAGIAAATRNNSQGISGVAPECRIMGVRVGRGNSIPYGYEGVYYACRAGAKVINCSWGGLGESAYEHDVINYVLDNGCVVVASGGNGASIEPHFPAGLEGVLSVAATGLGDQAATFTQFGTWVKVSAPGVGIVSTILGNNGIPSYAFLQGTSMSAPFVSGVCALVASRFPSMSGRSIASRVVASSDPIDGVNPNLAGLLGVGRINAWRAVADSVTGLRLGDVTYVETAENGDGRIRAGETAELRISVFNDFTSVSNVYGQISTTEDTVIISSPTSLYGDVPGGGPFWNDVPPFIISLPIESPRARILPLSVEWLDVNQRLLGRATHVVYLDSTFVAVDNGRMRLGFAENGSLGFFDYERGRYIGPGLRLEDRPSNALYHGSFVLAADGYVSDNGYGDAAQSHFDWIATTDSVAHIVPGVRADVEARACFEDSQAEQMLFARVEAAALGWQGPNENGFLILEYHITNRSVNTWTTAFAGFFLDWDLGAASANLSHYDSLSGIAYVSQVAPGHPLIGIVPLANIWNAYYVVDNRQEIDLGLDTVWTDSYKWQILTSGLHQSPSEPMDISHMVAVGPFSVASHDSLTVAFAMVTGQNIAELQANALAAESHYALRQNPETPVAKLPTGLYPNPTTTGADLHLFLPEAGPAVVKFYNILGRLVAAVPVSASSGGSLRFNTSALNGASGLLLYQVESSSGIFSGKILILK